MSPERKKPNIVFILSDDQGAWAMHCAGTGELETPNLDRIAREGMRFNSFFCASPVCSPARASLLTGLMPSRHGVMDWLRSGNVDPARFAEAARENPYGHYREEKEPIAYLDGFGTYTDLLKEQGYALALSGKWHLGDSVRPQHGFDRWYSLGLGGCYYMHPDIVENGDIRVRHGEYVTDLITDRACEDIRLLSRGSRPFYLSVHYTAPHDPWGKEHHPKKWIDHYDACPFETVPDEPDHPWSTRGRVHGTPLRRENLRGYFAAVSAMDEGIGRILETLEREGILDDTLLIFGGDNGMNMGHHGIWGKGNGTWPLNLFDTSVKVPFLVRCPFLVQKPGTVSDALVSALDVYPTLCDLAGVPKPAGLPGMSFLTLLRGKENARENVVVFDEYGAARMIRTRTHKLVRRAPDGPDAFYDLQSDPGETCNRIADPLCSALIRELDAQLHAFFSGAQDPSVAKHRFDVRGDGQTRSYLPSPAKPEYG